MFARADRQRCKADLTRNILAKVNAHEDMVAVAVLTTHARPDTAAIRAQQFTIVGMLEDRFRKAAEALAAAKVDVTAYAALPRAYPRKISSTNPLERINNERKRRLNVVGISPGPDLSEPSCRRSPARATRGM